MTNPPVHFYAVLRLDLDLPSASLDKIREHPDTYITVKEVVPSLDEAEREVGRLTALNADKGCIYFTQLARVFPDGRAVQPGS